MIRSSPIRSPRLRAALVALAALGAPLAAAQTLDGEVVEATAGTPLPGLRVRLLRVADSTATVVDSTRADSLGRFQLVSFTPGIYQLAFGPGGARGTVSAPDTLRGDTTVTRRYAIPVRRWAADGPFLPGEADVAAKPDRRAPMPRCPHHLRTEGVSGEALLVAVVDTLGRIPGGNVIAIRGTNAGFTNAVSGVVERLRFEPARFGGVPVQEAVCQLFRFTIVTDTDAPTPPPGSQLPPVERLFIPETLHAACAKSIADTRANSIGR